PSHPHQLHAGPTAGARRVGCLVQLRRNPWGVARRPRPAMAAGTPLAPSWDRPRVGVARWKDRPWPPPCSSRQEDAMSRTILLAAALQNWEPYSAHALAARDVAAALASHAERLHVLTVYESETIHIPPSIPADMAAKFREQQMDQSERLVTDKMDN